MENKAELYKKITAKLKEINSEKEKGTAESAENEKAALLAIQIASADSIVKAIEENTSVLQEILVKLK